MSPAFMDPPTTTTNHQPPTTNHQPPTTNHQPGSYDTREEKVSGTYQFRCIGRVLTAMAVALIGAYSLIHAQTADPQITFRLIVVSSAERAESLLAEIRSGSRDRKSVV